MNNCKNIYKLIDGLESKIKKMEHNSKYSRPEKSIKFDTYQVMNPLTVDPNKKYHALFFEKNGLEVQFIKINNSNVVLNYTLYFDIDLKRFKKDGNELMCVFVGVKSKFSSKVKIMKGTKQLCHPDVLVGTGTGTGAGAGTSISKAFCCVSNTVIYSGSVIEDEELCLIVRSTDGHVLNSDKSIFKIMFLK